MTREEAIKELEILKEDYWDDDGYGHETKQYDNTMLALDMAIKALEQESKKGKWIVKEESAYPCRGHMWCECDNCGYSKNAEYHDLAYGDTPKYIMPQFCERCGNKKSNTVIYPTK